METAINEIYKLRNQFLIIGLTGRTGSGCSSIADMLSEGTYEALVEPLNDKDTRNKNDLLKEEIVLNFFKENKIIFEKIKASDVIFTLMIELDFDIIENILQIKKEDLKSFDDIKEDFKERRDKLKEIKSFIDENRHHAAEKDKVKEYHEFFRSIPDLRIKFDALIKKINNDKNTVSFYQKMGQYLRGNTSIINDKKVREAPKVNPLPKEEISPTKIAEWINRIIKIIRQDNANNNRPQTYIVVDSLRNPFEILFFRERYSAFYMLAVTTTESTRRENLKEKELDYNLIDSVEYPKKSRELSESLSIQNIQKCIELSDIFLSCEEKGGINSNATKIHLQTYVALMLHPGLVQPTPIERVMQVALTAKLNSGCLSRQVGAAVTDKDYSIKSIGWNTVPKGQVPCSLRSLKKLMDVQEKVEKDENYLVFSKFEAEDETFKSTAKNVCSLYNDKGKTGLPIRYCFKQLYNIQEGDGNQVHTRSLHAEENAFLQLAKYGSQGIDGGFLFTTASCCELCSKKAYQLGIKTIYYIDPYPGISANHILSVGVNKPVMKLFSGIVGTAYIKLYSQFIPIKDEIAAFYNVSKNDLKEAIKGGDKPKEELKKNNYDKDQPK